LLTSGGRALNEMRLLRRYNSQSNSEYLMVKPGSETAGDKLRSREGNSPDQQLRCLNIAQWKGGGTTETVRMLA